MYVYKLLYMKSSDAKASKCHLKFFDHFYQACIFKFSDFTKNGNDNYQLIVI